MAKSFTDDSFRRVAQVVLDHEREPRDLTPTTLESGTPLPFQFRRFELAEPFAMDTERSELHQTALAYFLNANGRAEDGTDPKDRAPFVVTDILNTRFGLGNGELSSPFDRGSQGTAYHPHDIDRWEVLDMRAIDMMRFELKENLVPGGTVDAFYLDSVGSIQSGVVFPVTDFLKIRRGRKWESSQVRGSQGYAWYMHDERRFEIIEMQPHALRITGFADGTVTGSAAVNSITLSNPVIMFPTGAIALQDLTTGGLVRNAFKWDVDNGGRVDAVWNESIAGFDGAQAQCPGS